MRRVIAAVVFMCLCVVATPKLWADVVLPSATEIEEEAIHEENDRLDAVRVGIAGVYKNGFPTKVEVLWSCENVSNVELETVDSDGTPFITTQTLNEEQVGQGRCELVFIFPRANGALTVRLRDENGVVLQERVCQPGAKTNEQNHILFNVPTPASKPLYFILGDEKQGFLEAFGELRLKEDRRPLVTQINSIQDLPTDFRALESVDRLFLSSQVQDAYNGYSSSSEHFQTLNKWVERGGKLVLFAGANSPELLRAPNAWSQLSPGRQVEEELHEFRVLNSITTTLQNVKNLAMNGSRTSPYLKVPVISDLKPGAKVEIQEAQTPLLVACPQGLGDVVYFAGDLSEPPFSNWSGRGRLMLKVLGINPERTIVSSPSGLIQRGYVDLSGQLRSALDQFNGVRSISFVTVAVILILYLLAIAPLDWFISKKLLRKPILTWVTFPLYILLFAAISVGITRAKTPKETVLNQVDMLDLDMTSGIARDSSWFGFYSPVGTRYEFTFAPEMPSMWTQTDSHELSSQRQEARDVAVSLMPLTLVGSGIGGSEQRARTQRMWDEPYRLDQGEGSATIAHAPMPTRSSKSLIGRWTAQYTKLPEVEPLFDDGLTLQGQVVNPFDAPLYSAYLIYDGGAYALGTLAPGVTPIDRGVTRVEPLRVLNEHQSSIPESRRGAWNLVNYNVTSRRAPYILRAASFYDFAGGEDNFGIANYLQRDVDLSELLRCGRAVLIGILVDPQAEEYRPTSDQIAQAADAQEHVLLEEKLAQRRGEQYRSVRAEAAEKYGFFGSTDSLSIARLTRRDQNQRSGSDASATGASDSRTVVARIILPMERASSR